MAEVAKVMSPNGDIPNEAVARELAPLKAEPEKVREVYAEAVEAVALDRAR